MKNKTAFATVVIACLSIVGFASARPEMKGDDSPERLFAKMDADNSRSISETELTTALQHRDERRLDRIAKLEERGSPKADEAQARYEVHKEDPMLGSPETAAAFIIANFDVDGDWELDREEMGQAFSSIRKWRDEASSRAS
ncbi:hypothetical protein [Pelagicoccus mobilis]|uniref:EF-hand domain-containing protein n=1 Tax=Pelagicoccus mobilis TaxID=415221 RepID=A0A934S1Z8_9BACT|nr:hypothetical protein [Pelagicoccus mobilis]MBK1880423.1 hypothetical protein [Pelagicoccus mobilis]